MRVLSGVAAWNQYIYVVGGYDGASQLASVERYDTERNAWEEVAPMRAARSALSLAVLDNKLYAMGEYSTIVSYCSRTRVRSNFSANQH